MPTFLQERAKFVVSEKGRQSSFYWFFAFFVVSGFCGLIYEVVWVRLAMASFGVNTAVVSIVISMFMAGLGLGSWLAGRMMHRVCENASLTLRIYAVAELLIGISSLAVPLELKLGRQLLVHFGRFSAWQSWPYFVMVGMWISLTLVPWCACMGSTFPILMAVIRGNAHSPLQRSFSYLYLANVIGALLGTVVSAFILIELLGFSGTLRLAGSCNALLAGLALWLGSRIKPIRVTGTTAPVSPARTGLYQLPRKGVLVLLFTTGLVTMGIEVVWIRQYTPYLGNVVYAFAQILAVYLFATAMGSRDYRLWAKTHEPGESTSTWSLLALFCVLPVLAVDPSVPLAIGTFTGLIRLAAIVPFCAIAGFLTPLLVDSWSGGDPRRAGTAYAVNISGCIVGPLLAGFCLLPAVGERWAVLALAVPIFAISTVVAALKPDSSQGKKSEWGRLAICYLAATVLLMFSKNFDEHFRGRVVRRDYTATVFAAGNGFARRLWVNGNNMTGLSPVTKYISHLPLAFMQRRPTNGLVICFGMGTSFRSMLSWGIPATTVDLVPSVPALFGYFHSDASTLVKSPAARIVIDDGRRFLDGSTQTYDVIVVDPPPPVEAPGSSLLYSREFYAVIKQHLAGDGILQIWYPAADGDSASTAAITKAITESFPHVRAFRSFDHVYGIHFLASMQPIPTYSSAILADRLPPAAASDLIEWGPGANPKQQFDVILSGEVNLQSLIDQDPSVPAIQDDQPINEYYFIRRWINTHR